MAVTAPERKLFVGGEWIETGEWIEVRSPYSGEVVGRVAKASADHRRGRQAAQGGEGRGGPGGLHVHDGRSRGAPTGRRDGADGRLPGGRRQARVHDPPP